VPGCEIDIPLGGKGKGITSEVFTSTNANVGNSCICGLGTVASHQLFLEICIRQSCTLKAPPRKYKAHSGPLSHEVRYNFGLLLLVGTQVAFAKRFLHCAPVIVQTVARAISF
jgi:hypothetical protein